MEVKLEESQKKILTHRIIALLNREEVEFLDKLGKDALFSTGKKLSYVQIIKGLVDFAMECGINGNNLESSEKLKEKLLRRFPIIIKEAENMKHEESKNEAQNQKGGCHE